MSLTASSLTSITESSPQEKRERLILEVLDHAASGNLVPFIANIISGKLEVDQMDSRGYTAIHLAVWAQDQPSVLRLLDTAGCPIDLRCGAGQTPLMLATAKGNLNLMKLFLDRGADIEAKDSLGITPLISAAQTGQIASFYVLLHRGAKIDVKDKNECGVIHWAAYRNQVDILRILHKMGVDVNQTDSLKMTPLHRAAMGNALDSVDFLLFAGASSEIMDSKNRKPKDVAKEGGCDGAYYLISNFSPNSGVIHKYFSFLFVLYWIVGYYCYWIFILPYTVHYIIPSILFNFCVMWIAPLFV